jgi:single-stranded-DNA-specific exonuclease RecJ
MHYNIRIAESGDVTMFHNKRWICDFSLTKNADKLAVAMNISPVLAAALASRGMIDPSVCERYLYPRMEDLHDPFLMPDMDKAVDRVIAAISRDERICIYGDYDVDGITSVSLLIKTLRSMNADAFFYIPNRLDEGYGLNRQAIEDIKAMGAKLVITVDCGITSVDEVGFATDLGLEMIITDHHQCQQHVPAAAAVINPKLEYSNYPFKDLAGVGVAYKLCKALEQRSGLQPVVDSLLDIVAVGTVADIVPLTGENRVLVAHGLRLLQTTQNPGLNALKQVSGLAGKQVTSGHIAFGLAPRINAAGRLAHAQKGVELLLTDSDDIGMELAKEMDAQNRERQNIEKEILDQAIAQAECRKDDSILIMASESWHPGVIGIVASRVVERFNKPCVLFCIEGDEARGSGRSVDQLDLFRMLSACRHYYNRFGGHRQAAGLSMDADKLDDFKWEINRVVEDFTGDMDMRPTLRIDADLTGIEVTVSDIEQLNMMEPLGFGNPGPVFVKRGIGVIGTRMVGRNEDHLKIGLLDQGRTTSGIAFGWRDRKLPIAGERVDLVFTPMANEWMGKQSIQYFIKDIRRLEYNREFLEKCNRSLDLLAGSPKAVKTGIQCRQGCVGAMGIDLSKKSDMDASGNLDMDAAEKLLAEVFQESSGNMVITNSREAAARLFSVLSMLPGTKLCIGPFEGYNASNNYIALYPVFDGQPGVITGKLFIHAPLIFPDQYQAAIRLAGGRGLYLLKESVPGRLVDEIRLLLPNIEVLRKVYTLIRKNKQTTIDCCLEALVLDGVDPVAVLRAMDTLAYSGLIAQSGETVEILPPPAAQVDITKSKPYMLVKDFVRRAIEICESCK